MDTENDQTDLQEVNEKLDELTEMVKQNQRMIRSVYHRMRIASAISVAKWVIIIALSVGSLYFIQPYLNFLMNAYGTFGGGSSNGTTTDWSSLLKKF